MESNNWRPAQGEIPSSIEVPSSDWRSQLQPEARQRIINKIMDTLKRHLPVAGPEGMTELKKIAVRFEEKIYTAAVNQSDYLRKISLKMLSMETKTQQNTPINPQPGVNQNSTDTASMDSTAQIGDNGADWQEEIYQKIQAMKEAYLAELQEFHLKISQRYQQTEMIPHAKQSEIFEKLKNFKLLLEHTIVFLQISKNSVTIVLKEKIPIYEKQVIGLLSSIRRQRVPPSLQQGQQQLQLPGGHAQSTPQHKKSQVSPLQQHENHGNVVHQMSMPGSITTILSAVTPSMQHGSMTLPSLAAPATQQNATNLVQSASELDPVQVNLFGSVQQGSMGSVQQSGVGPLQNSVSAAQQTNLNNLSQSSLSALQPNATSLQNYIVLQQQHLKQQQQEHLMQNPQLNQQLQQRQIQPQLLQQQQRYQLLQPQQLLQQQVNHALPEEIREINQQLIDTVVSICDEDSDSVAAASEGGGEGTIVKCSFSAGAFSPSLKPHFASMHMSPIAPSRFLVPANYPECSPLLLDKLPIGPSKDFEDLSIKAKSRFSVSLQGLSQPMSLGEMAGTWDACTWKVIVEYAQQVGMGSFSSTYGALYKCVCVFVCVCVLYLFRGLYH